MLLSKLDIHIRPILSSIRYIGCLVRKGSLPNLTSNVNKLIKF